MSISNFGDAHPVLVYGVFCNDKIISCLLFLERVLDIEECRKPKSMDVLILEGDSFRILPSSGKAMNILFIKENKALIDELNEYILSLDAKAFFADSPDETEEILQHHSIDLVIIPLRALSNLEMLKYINENFKETKVVITVDREENAPGWENRRAMYTNYDLLQKQLRLFELKKAIGSGLKYSPN